MQTIKEMTKGKQDRTQPGKDTFKGKQEVNLTSSLGLELGKVVLSPQFVYVLSLYDAPTQISSGSAVGLLIT